MLGLITVALALLTTPTAPAGQQWRVWHHLAGVVDLAGPRSDASLVASAQGRLWLIRRDGSLRPFARGHGGYHGNPATEPYLDVAPPVSGRCLWQRDDLVALHVSPPSGVELIHVRGTVSTLAALPGVSLVGIASDRVGRFGHRVLVAGIVNGATSIYVIGCDGRPRRLARNGPHMEGGMVVAPLGFGRYGGDLVTANELGGRIYAITPSGRVALVSASPFAHGPDIGVESLGFVPSRATAVIVADRGTPRNPHPGTDSILIVSAAQAALRTGDLVAVDEGGAQAAAIRCAARCSTRILVAASTTAHVEGHVGFLKQP